MEHFPQKSTRRARQEVNLLNHMLNWFLKADQDLLVRHPLEHLKDTSQG